MRTKELEDLKMATLNCFYFMHDIITDIADESEEWLKLFNEEFDKCLEELEKL